MKKKYLSFLLTTTTLFLSCMEKEQEKPKRRTNYEVQFPAVSPSTISPTQQQTHCVPVYCEANQLGWQQLDAIANMTYHQNKLQTVQQSATNEFELKPVYKPANTNITQQEQKSLVKTTTSQKTNLALFEQLYQNAYQYAHYQRTTEKPNWITSHKNLTFLIHNINIAKKHGLTEDDLGQFAYQSYNHDATSKHIPLIFALLKRYNCTVNDTKEALPFEISDSCDKKLSQMFGIESQENSQKKSPQSADELEPYPAYAQLTNNLTILLTRTFANTSSMHCLTLCLHADEKILFSGYSDGSYENLLNDFYTKAYCLFFFKHQSNCLTLYEILLIINKARTLGAITKETDLGHAVLNFDPAQNSIFERITHWCSKIDFKIETKNRIALLCKLIEQYNNTDINKKRPTARQYYCYEEQQPLNLIIPNSITSLNENYYAFAAFKKLKNDFVDLGNSTDNQGIQLCVNKVYYNK